MDVYYSKEESLLDDETEQKIVDLVRDTISFCKWSILCVATIGVIEGVYTYSVQNVGEIDHLPIKLTN